MINRKCLLNKFTALEKWFRYKLDYFIVLKAKNVQETYSLKGIKPQVCIHCDFDLFKY